MEAGDNHLKAIIRDLHEHAREICLRRLQQVQEDEASLKREIDKLNLHTCFGSREDTASWLETEEIRNAYQKAREDRDECKFQLNVYKNKVKELEKKLDAVRLNQTQHNISIDLSQNSERKSCAYSFRLQPNDSSNKNDAKGEPNTVQSVSEEMYKRELNYLHKTNEKHYEEIQKLKAQLTSQEALLEKLNSYERETTSLRKIVQEKEEKMMNMQIAFDEKLKFNKLEFAAQISVLNNRIKELEMTRDSLNIELGAAQEEIRSLQLSHKKPVEEVTELGNCVDILDKAVINSLRMNNVISLEKEEFLHVNIRKATRSQLQAIENVIEHPASMRISQVPFIDQQLATVDEANDLGRGVARGTKRGQRGGKGSKKELAVTQKEAAKKMKSSEEKNTESLQTIENESIDANSSNARKGARTRAAEKPRKKAINSSIDTAVVNNKQNKKLRAKLEADENVEPSSLEYTSPSLNGTVDQIIPASSELVNWETTTQETTLQNKKVQDKIKLAGHTSTPLTKVMKKVQDDSRRANRRRNK